jgi:hypothetical protein
VISHPGQGQHLDLRGPSLAQHSGALVDGGAGGKYIVEKQNAFAAHLLGKGDPEGALDIASPFFAAQVGLGRGSPPALEQVEMWVWSVPGEKGPGQELRLIESPLAQPAGMKRNGENEIGSSQLQMGQTVAEKISKGGQAGHVFAVFPSMDGPGQFRGVKENGPGSMEKPATEALAAKMVMAGGMGKGHSTAGAKRTFREAECRQAAGAKKWRLGNRESPRAGQTGGRKAQVFYGPEKGGQPEGNHGKALTFIFKQLPTEDKEQEELHLIV